MAEEIIFKVSTDTGDTVKKVSDVEKALKGANASTIALNKSNVETSKEQAKVAQSLENSAKASTDFAAKMAAIKKEVDSGDLSFRQMNKKVQEYQSIAIAAGRTSPIGQEALNMAAALQDELGDLRNETSRLADDHKNLSGVMQIGTGVVAGYGAVQSSMALVGVENEDLQKSMQKLMAIQTLLNSVQQIKLMLEKESSAMILINTVRTKAMAIVQAGWTAAMISTSVAMKGLGVAIKNIPIVGWIIAIVAALIALIAIIYNMTKANEVAEAQNDSLTKSYDRQTEALSRSSAKQGRDMDNLIKLRKAQGASVEELHDLEMEKLKKEEIARVKDKNLQQMTLAKKTVAYRTALREENWELAKSIKGEIDAVRTKYKDLKDLDGQYGEDKKLKQTEFENDQKETAAADQQKANDAWKSAQEKRKSEQERINKEKIDQQRMLADLMVANIEDEFVRTRAALLLNQERERADLIAKYPKNTALLAELDKKQKAELAKSDDEIKAQIKAKEDAAKVESAAKEDAADKVLNDKRNRDKKAQLELQLLQAGEDFEARMQLKREQNELELQIALEAENLTENEIALINEKFRIEDEKLDEEQAEKKKQLAKDVQSAAKQTAEMGLAAITQISDIFFENQLNQVEKGSAQELAIRKKQFAMNKKLQIGQAIMQGVQAVQAAYSSGFAIPLVGAVTGPLFAAAAGVSSLMNINKIKNTTFDSGGGSVSAPSVPAPTIPDAASALGGESTLTAGLQGSGSQQGQMQPNGQGQSIKVNIVDSDIKASLDNEAKVNVLNSIG